MRIQYSLSGLLPRCPFRILAASLVLLATLALNAGPAATQGDLYTVSGIPVDATDENAAAARVAAHASGHLHAFDVLLARLVPADEIFAVPRLEAAEIAALVQDFSVDNERTSAVRYLATLNFRFNPDSVRDFLGRNEVAFAEIRSEPALVLPILESDGQPVLWRQPNDWRTAWDGLQLEAELVPMVLPLGDLEDIAEVTAAQAIAGDVGRLEALARRYEVASLIICHLVLAIDGTSGLATAELQLRRFGEFEPQPPIYQSHLQQSDESRDGFLRRIARAAISEITDSWKQANLLRLAEQRSIMVTVPVADLAEWLQVKGRLDRVVTVVGSELAYMTRRSVDLMLTYIGDQDQLIRALAQQDLSLVQDPNEGWWRLGLASAAAPASE